ncbi:MAG: hypothetical protein ACRC4M_05655 [Mycoplasma sp.]
MFKAVRFIEKNVVSNKQLLSFAPLPYIEENKIDFYQKMIDENFNKKFIIQKEYFDNEEDFKNNVNTLRTIISSTENFILIKRNVQEIFKTLENIFINNITYIKKDIKKNKDIVFFINDYMKTLESSLETTFPLPSLSRWNSPYFELNTNGEITWKK